MNQLKRVILHPNKSDAVRRFHPWVFSGAIAAADAGIRVGDVVEVFSHQREYLATGHYSGGSIAVRIFSYVQSNDLEAVFRERFRSAFTLRQAAGLIGSAVTNAFRFINAEGDGMPGLVIDYYHGTAVLQAHSAGMYRHKELFTQLLREVFGDSLKAVYDKSAAALHGTGDVQEGFLYGESGEAKVLEHGRQFYVNFETGQKTGFFLDQRENRQLLAMYAQGKKVLNTFCYTGGFSVYAAAGGASLVHSVDSSAKAIDLANRNMELNGFSGVHEAYVSDIFEFFKQSQTAYELMILDPPAFAKNQSARHQAVQAYKRLNAMAFKRIVPGGIIFTFSCSQAVGPDLFQGAVMAAAIEAGRQIKILHQLSQPADHPISVFHPEGHYLKGLVLYVE